MITREDIVAMGYEDGPELDAAVTNVNAQGWQKTMEGYDQSVRAMIQFTIDWQRAFMSDGIIISFEDVDSALLDSEFDEIDENLREDDGA